MKIRITGRLALDVVFLSVVLGGRLVYMCKEETDCPIKAYEYGACSSVKGDSPSTKSDPPWVDATWRQTKANFKDIYRGNPAEGGRVLNMLLNSAGCSPGERETIRRWMLE